METQDTQIVKKERRPSEIFRGDKWLNTWLNSFKDTLPQVDEKSKEMAVAVGLVASAMADNEDFALDARIDSVAPNVMATIGAIAMGHPMAGPALEPVAGMSCVKVRAIADLDKRGVGVLLKLAEKIRASERRAKLLDELDNRVKNGTERAFVLRKGMNNDEIVTQRVQSDTLLTKALEIELKEKEIELSAGQPTNTVNIGTINNMPFIPDYLKKPQQ